MSLFPCVQRNLLPLPRATLCLLCVSGLRAFSVKSPPPSPPRHSLSYFQQLAEQERQKKKEIEEQRARNPLPVLRVEHRDLIISPFFTQYQQMQRDKHYEYLQQKQKDKHKGEGQQSGTVSASASVSVSPALPPSPNLSFAVFDLLGRQHKVVEGDMIMSDSLSIDVGKQLLLTNVLLLGTKDFTLIGRPLIPAASVLAVVEEHNKTEKILVFHKKRRKNHRKMRGHRDDVTILKILKIRFPPADSPHVLNRPALTQTQIEIAQGTGEAAITAVVQEQRRSAAEAAPS